MRLANFAMIFVCAYASLKCDETAASFLLGCMAIAHLLTELSGMTKI